MTRLLRCNTTCQWWLSKLRAASREHHPSGHIPGHVSSGQKLRSLSPECELGVKDSAEPVRRIAKLIIKALKLRSWTVQQWFRSQISYLPSCTLEQPFPGSLTQTPHRTSQGPTLVMGFSTIASGSFAPGEGVGQYSGSKMPGKQACKYLNVAREQWELSCYESICYPSIRDRI